MAIETLDAIQKRIDALVARMTRLGRKKAPALRQIVRLARANAIPLSEIRHALNGGTTAKKGSRPKRKVAAMYENPKTGETWSGRGRPARWLAAAEKNGRKRAEFLIKR